MFILDLIHKLIPIMGIRGRDGTPGGGRIAPDNAGGRAKAPTREDLYTLSNTERQAIVKTAGDVANLFTPTPDLGSASQFNRENLISSAAAGAAVGTMIGGPIGTAVGFGFALVNYTINQDSREEAERKEKERKEREWKAAVEQHKAGLRKIGKSLRAQDKALSYAKLTKLTAAHGQTDLAYDARIAASQSMGSANLTAQRSSVTARENLDAILTGQERILEAKMRDLDELQGLIAAELYAERVFHEDSDKNKERIKTESYEDFQAKTREYEEKY